MNDRFKFRCWDKINEIWVKNFSIDEQGCVEGFYNPPKAMNRRFVLMQCTGLKDKNGKLIYEGDVVNGSCGVYWGKMIVEYNVAGFVLNKNGKYLNFLEGDNFIEVIGNKFENPELLKECE